MSDEQYALRIPNKEIMSIFSKSISKWVCSVSRRANLNAFKDALWQGDADTLSKEITKVLNDTLSYNDIYHEYVYHLFLAGLLTGLDYSVASNKEFGMGRPDIVVFDSGNSRAALFEIKGAGNKVETALKQIAEKKYLDGLRGFAFIVSYGIRFEGKTAEVKLKDKIEK